MIYTVDSYFLAIVLFFTMWISLFHCVLASWKHITKKFVKYTDYFYFSFTIIGVILAAIAQGSERDVSYVNVVLSGVTVDPAKLAIGIKDVMKWCDKFPWLDEDAGTPAYRYAMEIVYGSRLHPKLCDLLTKTDYILDRRDYAEIPNFVANEMNWNNIRPIIQPDVPYRLLLSLPNRIRLTIDYAVTQALRLNLESIYYRNAGGANSVASKPTLPTAITKLFYAQLWPFFLALAAALRMTRVTADVTEWPI
jgi:hypothetical protein